MKHVKFILLGLILGFGLATFTHTALALNKASSWLPTTTTTSISTVRRHRRKHLVVGSISQNIVTVFAFDGKNWAKQAELIPRGGGSVGWSVNVSGDSLIIGVPHDDAGAETSGSAFVYVRRGKNWDQRAKLGADDPTKADNFGYAVAIDRIPPIVGVPKDDDAGRDSDQPTYSSARGQRGGSRQS